MLVLPILLRVCLLALLVAGVMAAILWDRSYASHGGPREAKEDSKISAAIRDVIQDMQSMGVTRSNTEAMGVSGLSVESFLRIDETGNIQAYVFVSVAGQDELQVLQEHEVTVELVNGDLNIIQCWIPFDRVEDVAALEFVRRVQTPDYAHIRIGSVNSKGDQILNADLVRSQLGFAGFGIKVGVISDGVDSLAAAQSTGDLPGGIEIDASRPGSGDEGTAMLEIVHDLAPGAQLAFSGPNTSLEMVQSVNFLANTAFGDSGADIVVDDLGFFGEPFFEDGPIALAVAGAVASGTIYVSSAGNDGATHYEGEYLAGAGAFHDFGGGDIAMRGTLPGFGFTQVLLQWNDRFGASGNDYDLWVCPAGLNPRTTSSYASRVLICRMETTTRSRSSL